MDKLKLGLIGCGGMGTRHLYGLGELAKTPFNNIELCALCDLNRDNAELAAREAEQFARFKTSRIYIYGSNGASDSRFDGCRCGNRSVGASHGGMPRHWTWDCMCWLKNLWLFP